MIKFDDGGITEALKKKKLCNNIAYALFAVLLISALVSAVLTKNAVAGDSDDMGHVAALCVTAVLLLIFSAVIIFGVAPTNRALKLTVCKAMAKGLLEREDMFRGGGSIEFTADYSDDVLTLSRKGYTGEITINPARLKTVEGLGSAGAKAEIDLKPLKSAPSVYATAGNRLWQFLQAYYLLYGEKNGADSVTVTDNMGKTPLTLQVYNRGVPAKNAKNNYFIKKGLIR